MSGPGHTSVSFGSWLAKQIWLLWVNIIPHRSVRSVAGGKNAAGTRGLERVPVGNMAFGRVQDRVLERHVCPPGHEQRPLHSRHLLRSPHGGFLLLECDGVYQHKLHISLKHVRTLSYTEWREAMALFSPIGRALLQAPQAVVNVETLYGRGLPGPYLSLIHI